MESAIPKNVSASRTWVISTLGDLHHGGCRECLTVSRAIEKEEGTEAVGGLRRSRGALFWTLRAVLAILRSEEDEESGPKEMEWKDSGVL
jgi:hypothetical protein